MRNLYSYLLFKWNPLVLLLGIGMFGNILTAQTYPFFTNQLFVPDTVSSWPPNTHSILDLTIQEDQIVLFPNASPSNPPIPGVPYRSADNLPIATMSYTNPNTNNPGILGPTLVWWHGDSVTMNVYNDLMMQATTHWHGAHVAPWNDGGPHQIIQPMSFWNQPQVPSFKVRDDVSTMWYHPHLHHHTMEQVQRGLAGMIIVKNANDPIANLLPHSYGVNDFPLVLQDKFVQYDPNTQRDTINWCCSLGTIPLVNGTWQPTLEVPNDGFVRFRILNGSSERTMLISLQVGSNTNDLVPFWVIASDAGYIDEPYQMNTTTVSSGDLDSLLIIMPGERYEIVFDAAQYQGDSLFLMNRRDWMMGNAWISTFAGGPSYDNPSCYSGGNAPNFSPLDQFPQFLDSLCDAKGRFPKMIPSADFDSLPMPLLQVVPVGSMNSGIASIPSTLASNVIPPSGSASVTRQKNLLLFNTDTLSPPFSIDSVNFDMELVNDFPCLNATEIWNVANVSTVAHPFHMHDIHFYITAVEYIDANGTTQLGVPPYMAGPKDVMPVASVANTANPGSPSSLPRMNYRFITTFTDFGTPQGTDSLFQYGYMYHCHILDHEDGGMMHQFVVISDCPVVGREDQAEVVNWKLFPNPSTGLLWMEAETSRSSVVTITDAQGRVVREWTLPAMQGVHQLDAERLPAGIYMVRWSVNGSSSTKRVSIMR